MVDAVQGIEKFAKEFLDLIDAADATAQSDIAREALKRLAAAGAVKGALQGHEIRGLALRLANHGELTRLSTLVNNLISLGLGREAAFAAALLGDNALMEKAWQETGMLAEAVLHSHAHGRPTLKTLVEAWNKALQKEIEHIRQTKTDATAAFLASLEDPKLPSLGETDKKPPIEILPPGMSALSLSISAPKKPTPAAIKGSQQEPGKPLLLGAPPPPAAQSDGAAPPSESGAADPSQSGGPSQPGEPSAESSQPGEAPPPPADQNQPGDPTPSGSSQLEASQSDKSNQPEPEPEAPLSADLSQPEVSPPPTNSSQPTLDAKVSEQALLDSLVPGGAKPTSATSSSPLGGLELLM